MKQRGGITREEARAIAEREIEAQGLGVGIRRVCALDELDRPPLLYAVPALDACWIAYVEPRCLGLTSSDVMLIDRMSGAVRYAGSAHDEG